MQNLFVIFIIGLILYFAIKPIIRFKKEKGSALSCYRCSHNKDGKCSSNNNSVELKI